VKLISTELIKKFHASAEGKGCLEPDKSSL
jgi:hypothetical protein